MLLVFERKVDCHIVFNLEFDSNDIRKISELIIFQGYSARRPFNVNIFRHYLQNFGQTQLSNAFMIGSMSVTTDRRNQN